MKMKVAGVTNVEAPEGEVSSDKTEVPMLQIIFAHIQSISHSQHCEEACANPAAAIYHTQSVG